MLKDVRHKAFMKYHKDRWFKFTGRRYSFEYSITSIGDTRRSEHYCVLGMDIKIRNIVPIRDHGLHYTYYFDKVTGCPKRGNIRYLNEYIRNVLVSNRFTLTLEAFGFREPIVEYKKIKWIR